MAQIKADEITQLLREQIANYDSKVQVDEVGTITSLGDGIARLHGLDKVMAGELLSFPARHRRTGAEPGRGFGGRGDSGRLHRAARRRRGQAHRQDSQRAGGRGHDRPRGERARQADRRQGADRVHGVAAHRASCAGHHRPPAGARADGDGPQGHRRDDSDWPRPARADYRRPPDGQDRRAAGHDHQQRQEQPDLHLLRHRPEALLDCAGGADADRSRSDGPHHHRGRLGFRARADALHRALRGDGDRRVLPRLGPARAGDVRRSLQARHGLPRDFAAAAPSAGPRSLSGRCLLSPLASAGALVQDEQGKGRRLA